MTLDINNLNAMRAWSMEGDLQVTQRSFFTRNNLVKPMKYAEKGVIVRMDELGKRMSGPGAGYDVTFPMLGVAEGYVETGNTPVDGTEHSTKYYHDKHTLNFRRKAFITTGKFNDQLSLRDGREDIMKQIREFWPVYTDGERIVKLAGAKGSGTWRFFDSSINPATNGRDVRGSLSADGNLLRAPSSGRYVYPAAITAASSLTTAHVMSLDVIDKAVLQAISPAKNTTYDRCAKPLIKEGKDSCIVVLDYLAVNDLYQTTGGRFFIVEQAKLQGGQNSNLVDGEAMPDLVAIYRTPYGVMAYILAYPNMPRFSTSDTGPDGTTYAVKTVRGMVLFQDAGRVITGKDSEDAPDFNLYEELRDAGAKLRITTDRTEGFQKTAYSTTETGTTRHDHGVVVFDTYALW